MKRTTTICVLYKIIFKTGAIYANIFTKIPCSGRSLSLKKIIEHVKSDALHQKDAAQCHQEIEKIIIIDIAKETNITKYTSIHKKFASNKVNILD